VRVSTGGVNGRRVAGAARPCSGLGALAILVAMPIAALVSGDRAGAQVAGAASRPITAAKVLLPVKTAQAKPGTPAGSSAAGSIYDRINRNTTTIMADEPEGTLMRLAHDMARVLDKPGELRVLPIAGQGARQNVTDLLHLKGIDIALTQADVLVELKRSGQLGARLEARIAYIAKVGHLEVHVVARADVATVADLDGKRVSFGPVGSGSQHTARAVFEGLGVKPIEVNATLEDARLAFAANSIDAYVFVDGKPSRLLRGDFPEGSQLLGLSYAAQLEADYLPAQLTSEDYPKLIPAGERVDTLAVAAILAVYDWPEEHERHQRVGRLVNLFFSEFSKFQDAPRHEKWREANLAAPFPGWKRFKPAQDWLDRRAPSIEGWRAGTGKQSNTGGANSARARALAQQVAPNNPAEQKRLIDLFMKDGP